MSPPRREVIKKALAAAVAVATPASIIAAQGKLAYPKKRYLLVGLKDGNTMAVDLEDSNRAYVLEKKRPTDGELRMRGSGSLVVKEGRLVGTKGKPESPGFSLFYEGEGAKRQIRNGVTGQKQSLRLESVQ